MSKSNTTSGGGVGLLGLLGILFVALKLTGVIDWSWWWVTLPFWGGIALIVGLVLLVWLGAFFCDIVRRIFR